MWKRETDLLDNWVDASVSHICASIFYIGIVFFIQSTPITILLLFSC